MSRLSTIASDKQLRRVYTLANAATQGLHVQQAWSKVWSGGPLQTRRVKDNMQRMYMHFYSLPGDTV